MYVQLCMHFVCTALYVHCTKGPVRPKSFHSEFYPYQIFMYRLVSTIYVHCMYIVCTFVRWVSIIMAPHCMLLLAFKEALISDLGSRGQEVGGE